MKRAVRALGQPPDVTKLDQLPRNSIQGTLYREHQARPGPDQGCWWFASFEVGKEPEGRFDLAEPRGTCYLGETLGVATRERCGRFLASDIPLPTSHLQGRVISSVQVKVDDLGDLTHPSGALIGVTAEIHSINDYKLTAQWAAQADTAGMKGLKYSPRFTPGQEFAYALFDDAGANNDRYPAPSRSMPLIRALANIGVPPRLLPSSAESIDDDEEPA